MEARSCDSEIFSKAIRTTYTLWYTRRDTVIVLWRSRSCKKASLCLCTSPEWQRPVTSNLQFIVRWHMERTVVFRNFGCRKEKRRKLKHRGQNPNMPTYFRQYCVSLRRERNAGQSKIQWQFFRNQIQIAPADVNSTACIRELVSVCNRPTNWNFGLFNLDLKLPIKAFSLDYSFYLLRFFSSRIFVT